MHKETLTVDQMELLPVLKLFNREFGLVGGTAIALYIGHRRSIDFDLFSNRKVFNNLYIKNKISAVSKIDQILVNKLGEFTFFINGVKITFFNYPFEIEFKERLDHIIKLPDLLTLAAMKAYALGMRAKWKDYVDMYFILKHYFSLNDIVKKSKSIFGNEFNEKIFRGQLVYFKDIDYHEEVVYLPGFEVSDKKVQKELINFSLSR